jgi:hypothetical protein
LVKRKDILAWYVCFVPQVKNRLDSALACVAEVRPRERVRILHVRSARLNSPLSDTNLPKMPTSRQTQRFRN